ncbi:MAG: alpha/beta hydrolase [Desulfobacteraceae bacterium]|nr:alpha/beta hydrolase [Desulfobacteraceae bacterium]
MKRKTLTVNNYEMTYVEKGQGAPLLFIHGSMGDYRSWSEQVDFFSKHFRAMSLSLRHCYPESWDGKGDDFTVQQHADDLFVFIKKLAAGPVHLVGHSRGGAVILKLLATHPCQVCSAVLADPAPFNDMLPSIPTVIREIQNRTKFIKTALNLIKKGNIDKGLETFTDAVSRPGTWKRLPEKTKQARRDNVWSLKSLVKDASEPFHSKELKTASYPFLLLTGQSSPPIYGLMHEKLEHTLQNFEKKVILNASHGMYKDNPNQFNCAVIDFILKNNAQ